MGEAEKELAEFWKWAGGNTDFVHVLGSLLTALDGNAHGDTVMISSGKGDQMTHEANFFIPKAVVRKFVDWAETQMGVLAGSEEAVSILSTQIRNLRDRHHDDAMTIGELKDKLAEYEEGGQSPLILQNKLFAECQRERDLARAKVAELEKTLDAFRDQKSALMDSWGLATKERDVALDNLRYTKQAFNELSGDHLRMTKDRDRLADNLHKLQAQVRDLGAILRVTDCELDEARSQRDDLAIFNSELQRECRKLEEDVKKAKGDAGFWKSQAIERSDVAVKHWDRINELSAQLNEAKDQIAYWEKAWKETLGEGSEKVSKFRDEIEGLKIDLLTMVHHKNVMEQKWSEAKQLYSTTYKKFSMVHDLCKEFFEDGEHKEASL